MAHEGVALARYACRDPDPGDAGPAIRRIDDALAAAERILATGDREQAAAAIAVAVAAATVAATEPVTGLEPGSQEASPNRTSDPEARRAIGVEGARGRR